MDQKYLTLSPGFTDWWVAVSERDIFTDQCENRGLLFQFCLRTQLVPQKVKVLSSPHKDASCELAW